MSFPFSLVFTEGICIHQRVFLVTVNSKSVLGERTPDRFFRTDAHIHPAASVEVSEGCQLGPCPGMTVPPHQIVTGEGPPFPPERRLHLSKGHPPAKGSVHALVWIDSMAMSSSSLNFPSAVSNLFPTVCSECSFQMLVVSMARSFSSMELLEFFSVWICFKAILKSLSAPSISLSFLRLFLLADFFFVIIGPIFHSFFWSCVIICYWLDGFSEDRCSDRART